MCKFKRIALDVQHIGKPHNPGDRGAGGFEAYVAHNYAYCAFCMLSDLEYDVFMITSGTYKERHEWVNKHGIDLYLACHVNAGGGDYSLVEHSHNAGPVTRKLAELMAYELCRNVGTSEGKVFSLKKGGRGAVCIDGVRPPALLLEPLFLDNEVHRDIALNKAELISKAIVDAIEGFTG